MFNHPDIIIPDQDKLSRKLRLFRHENTRVVLDWDSTVTTNGSPTSWGLLKDIRELTEEYHKQASSLYAQYHKHEIDLSLPRDVHNRLMQEWWDKHLALFHTFGFKKEHLKEVNTEKAIFRSGMQEGIRMMREAGIPGLILSAGLKQVIDKILDAKSLSGDYLNVTANELIFDVQGNYERAEPLGHIHVGNKNEQSASKEAQNTYAKRTNIILFGDRIQDIDMIQASERDSTVAIGFISQKKNDLDIYKRVFDIIICSDDSDLGVFKGILEQL